MNAHEVLGIEYAVLILECGAPKLEWSIAAADRFGIVQEEGLLDPRCPLSPSRSLDCGA